MKRQTTLMLLSWVIAALALIAAGIGVLTSLLGQAGGSGHYSFTNLRRETVQIWGGTGLYRLDSAGGAPQEIGQDMVTLLLGIPLLIVASVLASKGLLRGKVLLAGTLGYFLYTYTSMSMLAAYNELFLVYVALMSLCLFAFIMSLMSIDVAALPAHFSARFPRRTVAGFALFLGAMLAMLWLKLIVPPLLAGTPPVGLDSYATLVIQALDLGFIAPTAILTGVLLLRREAPGYLLSSVVLVIGLTMGAALFAMSIAQIVAGAPVDPLTIVMFTVLAAVDAVLTVLLLRSISEVPVVPVVGQLIPERAAPPVTSAPGILLPAASGYIPSSPPNGTAAFKIEGTEDAQKQFAAASTPHKG
jgi:hypothetical protein